MKNLLWGFAAASVLAFAACQKKDAQLSSQMQEQITAGEAAVPANNTVSQSLSALVSQVEQAPEELKKDTTSQYQTVYRKISTLQPKFDKVSDDYEETLGKLKTLAADYSAGKVNAEEAKKQYEALQQQLQQMGSSLESYRKIYDEFSADYAKMMADFKGKSN